MFKKRTNIIKKKKHLKIIAASPCSFSPSFPTAPAPEPTAF
jgi:hypothetical protein